MSEHGSTPTSGITLRDALVPVWVARKPVLVISFAAALLTLVVNLLLPNSYRAEATLLPETDRTRAGLTSQFAGLASLAGVNITGGDISRLYPVILTSDTVLRAVIESRYRSLAYSDSVNLIKYYQLDSEPVDRQMDDAVRKLKGALSAAFDTRTSVVTVSLEIGEPQLAADVLNRMLAELDAFLKEKKTGSASEQRKWIESRLTQVKAELRVAEDALRDFRERNRRITDSPQLMLVQERLARDVQVKSTIDVELMKQAELEKIEELKQVSTINVLDEGRAPVKKSGPKRATNTAVAFLLGIAATSGYFAVRQLYGSQLIGFLKSFRP